MRIFLCDAAERLALSVLTCDRVPIVAPWYAMTILAARAYAMAVYASLSKQVPASHVDFTTFSLVALAAGDPEGKLPNPARTLFNAGTKNMYLRSDAQDGQYWVLLRATLSGLKPTQAKSVAKKLCTIDGASPIVCTTAVMLCALMRTQAGMVIFSYRTGDDAEQLESYPLASKAATVVDGVRQQTVFDFVMNCVSGTLDLEMLSSDDLAFTAPQRAVAAWRGVGESVDASEKNAPRMGIVNDWCAAMTAIGTSWHAQNQTAVLASMLPPRKGSADGPSREAVLQDLFPAVVPSVRPVTTAERSDSLARVYASHAVTNHGQWLTMAFKFACLAEDSLKALKDPPLIRSHIDLANPTTRAMGTDETADNAWLRLNFRHQAEQVLHSGRRGGMFTAGNHLVLCAWVTVPVTAKPGDTGVRIFARAMTTHTVATSDPSARLFSDSWRQATERRGDDSIMAAALEFERKLHERNSNELNTLYPKRKEQSDKATKETGGSPDPPSLPYLHTSSRERMTAGAIAEGPTRFDGNAVEALDAATNTALQRFRLAATKAAIADHLFVCQVPFEHGVSVALVSSPAQVEEDLRPATEQRLASEEWQTREQERSTLMQKLRNFQRGVVPARRA